MCRARCGAITKRTSKNRKHGLHRGVFWQWCQGRFQPLTHTHTHNEENTFVEAFVILLLLSVLAQIRRPACFIDGYEGCLLHFSNDVIISSTSIKQDYKADGKEFSCEASLEGSDLQPKTSKQTIEVLCGYLIIVPSPDASLGQRQKMIGLTTVVFFDSVKIHIRCFFSSDRPKFECSTEQSAALHSKNAEITCVLVTNPRHQSVMFEFLWNGRRVTLEPGSRTTNNELHATETVTDPPPRKSFAWRQTALFWFWWPFSATACHAFFSMFVFHCNVSACLKYIVNRHSHVSRNCQNEMFLLLGVPPLIFLKADCFALQVIDDRKSEVKLIINEVMERHYMEYTLKASNQKGDNSTVITLVEYGKLPPCWQYSKAQSKFPTCFNPSSAWNCSYSVVPGSGEPLASSWKWTVLMVFTTLIYQTM